MHAPGTRRIAVALSVAILAIFLINTAAAQSNHPTHPLHHITPIDTDLNMSDNPNAIAHSIVGVGEFRGFFENNCDPNEVVQNVNEDGTFDCVPREVGDMSGSGSAEEVAVFVDGDTVSSYSNLFFDTSDQYLGVGTDSPSATLDVSGTASVGNLAGSGVVGGTNLVSSYESGSAYDDRFLNLDGDEMEGVLDMDGHNITGIDHLEGFFAAESCDAGEVVNHIHANGSVECVDVEVEGDDRTLEQVLDVGHEAGPHNINMTGSNIQDIGMLSVETALMDGNISESITIDDGGAVDPASLTRTLVDGEIEEDLTITATGEIDPGALNRSLLDGEVDDNLTISAQGDIDPTALNRDILDDEVAEDLTIDNDGTVNASAIEGRIAGNQLMFSDGVMDVDEGPDSGLDADTVWGYNLSDIDWEHLAIDETDVDPEDIDMEDLLAGDGITGDAYNGTEELEWNIAWTDAAALTTDGELDDRVVDNEHIAFDAVNRSQLSGEGCSGNEVLLFDGSEWECVADTDIGMDRQNLSDVLSHGNVANDTIDMAGEDIDEAGTVDVEDDLSGEDIIQSLQIESDQVTGEELDLDIEPEWTGIHTFESGIDVDSDITDGEADIWISDPGHVPLTALEEDTIEIDAGAFLSADDADVQLGESITLDVADHWINASDDQLSTGLDWDTDNDELFVTDDVAFTGDDEDITGSWTFEDDLTVEEDLIVMGNVTNTEVEHLNVNGSLLPPEEFDGQFDIGEADREWRDGVFAGTVDAEQFVQDGEPVLDEETPFSGNLSGTYDDLRLDDDAVDDDVLYNDDQFTMHSLTIDGGELDMAGDNIALNDGYISNDGTDEGIRIDDDGQVGIGTDAPEADMDVDGSMNVENEDSQMEMTDDGDVVITLGDSG